MPALGGELIDFLLQRRRPSEPATVLRGGPAGRLEPLAAIYEPAALAAIEAALDAGELSVTRLLEVLPAQVVEVPAALAGQLVNVNTPADLEALGPEA